MSKAEMKVKTYILNIDGICIENTDFEISFNIDEDSIIINHIKRKV